MNIQHAFVRYAAILAYVLVMAVLLAYMAYGWATLWVIFPLGLLIVVKAVVAFDAFLMVMVFFIPVSISIKDLGNGYGVSLPVEGFVAIAALILGFNFLRNFQLERRIVLHPVSLAILLYLFWIVITAFNSLSNEVSFKLLIARLSYILVFFLGFLLLFRDWRNILRFNWMYMLGLIPATVYAIYRLSGWGFARKHSPEMSKPFYDDHTVFGACIAMLLPLAFYLFLHRKTLLAEVNSRRWIWIVLPVLSLGLTFSFSRAAWLSIVIAALFSVVLRLRIPFTVIASVLLLGGGVAYFNQDLLLARMESNKADSDSGVLEAAQSAANLATDESNKERLNRWACAWRMYQEHPWMGFGPGTYEKFYAGYQSSTQTTRISTWNGDRGDAHSEYLTALSEQGLPGLVIHLILLATIFATGMRVCYQAEDPRIRILATGILLGFLTYLIHGGVNSFLDIDKAASLVWGVAAMLVALECWHLQVPAQPKSA
jgi:putative inorganic carbon (hco3(-)) transporter